MSVGPAAGGDPGRQLFAGEPSSEDRVPWRALAALAATLALAYTCFGLARLACGRANFDFCYPLSVCWHLVESGEWRIGWVVGGTHVYLNFQPILVLYAQIFRILPRVETLILLQAIMVGVGVLPAYLLGRELPGGRSGGWTVAALYAVLPMTCYWGIQDFRCLITVVPFLLLGWLGVVRGRVALALLGFGVACTAKQDIGLTMAWLGLVAMIGWRGRRRLGLALFLGGAAAFLFSNFLAVRWVGGIERNPLFAMYYGHLGQTPGQIVSQVLLHPVEALSSSFHPGKVVHAALYLAVFMGLPLLAPEVLVVGAPYLAYAYLARPELPQFMNIKAHYGVVFVPTLLVAWGVGVVRLAGWLERSRGWRRERVIQRLGVATVAWSALLCACLQVSFPETPQPLTPRRYMAHLEEIQRILPGDAALWVQRSMAPPFALRRNLQPYPEPDFEVPVFPWILLSLKERLFPGFRVPWRTDPAAEGPLEVSLEPLERDGLGERYEIALERDGVVLLRLDDTRRHPETMARLRELHR